MRRLINLPSDPYSLAPFADAAALRRFYGEFGCDGVELILCGEEFGGKLLPGMVGGLHLIFYPEWICLWQEDFAYLDREFGSREAWQAFYQAKGAQDLLDIYRHELAIAERLGAQYVVFHMGDNALPEYYTLRPRRSDEEIVDVSCAFLNEVFAGREYPFQLLLENMWPGGMNLTRPEMAARALEGVQYPQTGLMLDTGHLMATNPKLSDGDTACAYIHAVLDSLGPLVSRIRGMHLHASLSGEYRRIAPRVPPFAGESYLERYAETTKHLRQIDRHLPFTHPGAKELVSRIVPDFLVYELARTGMEDWRERLAAQQKALE